MAESKISPGELFKRAKLIDIKELTRKPNDHFYVFPVNTYVKAIKDAIRAAPLHVNYKEYLDLLVDTVATRRGEDKLRVTYETFKQRIDLAEVAKYFGEVIGPLFVLRSMPGVKAVVFPQRSNYELFDYFLQQGDKYHGYSAKADGGSSNTLVPGLIAERISALKSTKYDLGVTLVMQLAAQPTFKGTVQAVGLMASKNIFPATMMNDKALQKAFKVINWSGDAEIIERNKNTKIMSTNLSGKNAYLNFLSNHVVPRMKTEAGKAADFTCTNLIYGFIAMYLASISKEGAFDLTPTIRKLFPDLNIVKMGVDRKGVPTFRLIAKGNVEEVALRSKARWSVIKDKLGVQL
jgi:hypothetical protein